MGMASWIRHVLSLGAASTSAASELHSEMEKSKALSNGMEQAARELRAAREAVQAKAKAVMSPGDEHDERPPPPPFRPPLKSTSG